MDLKASGGFSSLIPTRSMFLWLPLSRPAGNDDQKPPQGDRAASRLPPGPNLFGISAQSRGVRPGVRTHAQ